MSVKKIKTKVKVFLPSIILLFNIYSAFSQGEPKDYIDVPGTLMFDSLAYKLAWSSHPTANYYKQEYLPKGGNIDSFSKMVFIDAILSDTLSLETAVDNKVSELKNRKTKDPVTNYKVFQNPEKTEYIVDFVVGEAVGGLLHIVEWNAYRYRRFTDIGGHKGVMLFGVSRRAYDNDINIFFSGLKSTRGKVINALINYNVPEIRIAK